MVMIARDEQANVRPCFDSFWPHVDEVVLCDTGSVDDTVEEARRYAEERGEPGKLIVGRFEWCDDFGAARTYAHSLATGDVHAYIDLDDRLEGAEHLGSVVAEFANQSGLGTVWANYYMADETVGKPRPRFARAPVRWLDPTYEAIEEQEGASQIYTSLVRWRHAGDSQHGRRDLDIALKWSERDPENWWPWYIAAKEAAFPLRDAELLFQYGNRALALGGGVRVRPAAPANDWRGKEGAMQAQQRAFLYQMMMLAAYDRDDMESAELFGRAAVALWWGPRACLLIARCSFERGDPSETTRFARMAMRQSPDDREVRLVAEDLIAASNRQLEIASAAILSGWPLPSGLLTHVKVALVGGRA
jgi:glycosyltransferase involved in cell wall biosynthesis